VWIAELAWRWALGAALLALAAFAGYRWLDSVVVVGRDPLLGAGSRLFRLAAVMIGGWAALSVIAGACGRCATLPLLFRRVPTRPNFRALAGNGSLRAAVELAAAMSLLLAWRLATSVAGAAEEYQLGWFLLALVPMSLMIAATLAVLYWFLSVAPLFSVAQARDSLGAVEGAVELAQRKPAAFVLVSGLFGFARAAWFASAISFSFGLAAAFVPFSRVAALVIFCVAALVAFAGSGFLRLCFLAATAALIEDEEPTAELMPSEPDPAFYAQPVSVAAPS
jgi:hypothetical protein